MDILLLKEKFKEYSESNKFILFGYEYPFEFIELPEKEVVDLLLNKGANTISVISITLEQRKWTFSVPEQKSIDELDNLFRWPCVNHGARTIGFEAVTKEEYINQVHLLLNYQGEYFGLKTHACYLPTD